MDKIRMRTLKDLEHFQELKHNHKWGVVFSQHCNSFQFYTIEDDYYVEVGSSARGGIAERDEGSFIYDIAADPESSGELREKLLGILGNRAENDLHAVNELIKIIKAEKQIDIEPIKKFEIISRDD